MKTNKFDLDKIIAITTLDSEMEVEQATSLISKLKWMQLEDKKLKPLRAHLVDLIEKYEAKNWSDVNNITDEQVEESDKAEWFISQKNNFIQRRKETIKTSLKNRDLKQKDLAIILGRSVSYLSEQLNGLRQFSNDDIKILNRSFKIPLHELFDLYLEDEKRKRVLEVLKKYPKAHLELKKEDLLLR